MIYWFDVLLLLFFVYCLVVFFLWEYDFLDELLDVDDEGEWCDFFFLFDGFGGVGEEVKEEVEGFC